MIILLLLLYAKFNGKFMVWSCYDEEIAPGFRCVLDYWIGFLRYQHNYEASRVLYRKSYTYSDMQSLRSRRRPVSMEERKNAELAAAALNATNPSVVVVFNEVKCVRSLHCGKS